MRCLATLLLSLSMIAAELPPGAVGLKAGNPVKVRLVSGRTVSGALREIESDRLILRVDRGFFRTREERFAFNEIRRIERERGRWVGPAVALGISAAAIIGVAICVSSGACRN